MHLSLEVCISSKPYKHKNNLLWNALTREELPDWLMYISMLKKYATGKNKLLKVR